MKYKSNHFLVMICKLLPNFLSRRLKITLFDSDVAHYGQVVRGVVARLALILDSLKVVYHYIVAHENKVYTIVCRPDKVASSEVGVLAPHRRCGCQAVSVAQRLQNILHLLCILLGVEVAHADDGTLACNFLYHLVVYLARVLTRYS